MDTNSHRVQLPPTVLPLNTITPYLRARLEVADDCLRWESPRTVLGIIPIGSRRVEIPLGAIKSVGARYGVYPVRLLLGAGLLAVPFLVTTWWAAAGTLAAAGALLLLAPAARLDVVTADGRAHRLGICIRHRLDVDLIAAALDDLITPTNPSGSSRPTR